MRGDVEETRGMGAADQFEKWNKPLSEKAFASKSLSDAKKFVANYFEDAVVDVDPNEFPNPDEL